MKLNDPPPQRGGQKSVENVFVKIFPDVDKLIILTWPTNNFYPDHLLPPEEVNKFGKPIVLT